MRHTIVPGIDGSDSDHWQTPWEPPPRRSGSYRAGVVERTGRGRLARLARPGLRRARGDEPALLVARSLGCHAGVLWAERRPQRVAGLLLVAPPEPLAVQDRAVGGFSSAAAGPLAVPGLVVASSNDSFGSLSSSERLAAT